MEKSHVSVQARLSKAFLQKTIEKEMQGLIGANGIILELPQGKLLIERIDNIKYIVSSQDIQLAAEIEVEYNKEEGIPVEGQATIQLLFNIAYTIQPDFTLSTSTRLASHEWIEKPNVKVGKLSIPSKGALNLLINSFDEKLGRQIDNIIGKKLDLRKVVTTQLTRLENPIPNPIDKNIHLFINPDNLLFNIAEGENDYALSVHTTFDAEVKWELQKSQKIFSSLPHIEEYDGTATMSQINVPVKVDFEALSKMLVKQFSQVEVIGRNIQVKAIDLSYTGSLNIRAQIEGDLSGNLNARAKPRLDVSSQTLFFDNLEYDLSTSNILVKAATFLFKGEIDKRIDQFSHVPLKPIFRPLIKNLNSKLEEFTIEGLDFRINMDSLEVVKLDLKPDHLLAYAVIKANQTLV